MTLSLPPEGNQAAEPKVALVGSPHHTLGIALCRHLAAQGVRLVITDPQPSRGAAVCRRLAWQGVSASYRYFSAEAQDCEHRLYEDLALVFGRLDWLISFFDVAPFEPAWLALEDAQVEQLLMPQIQFRRRLLKALDPLFSEGAMHLQVCMDPGPAAVPANGAAGAPTKTTAGTAARGWSPPAASAALWDQLLSRYLRAGRIRTRTLSVRGPVETIDQAPALPRSIERDLSRLISALH